jgi:hypothetical protein
VENTTVAAAPGATLLLYGFTRPPRAAPMYAHLSTDEVRERFQSRGWELLRAEPMPTDAVAAVGRSVDGGFEVWRYQLLLRHQQTGS